MVSVVGDNQELFLADKTIHAIPPFVLDSVSGIYSRGCRDVAQSGRAPALGAGSRTFESCHPDHLQKRKIMGSRYLVTGVQLGLLAGLAKAGKCEEVIDYINEEIIDFQCVGATDNTIEKDVEKAFELFSGPLPDSFRHDKD